MIIPPSIKTSLSLLLLILFFSSCEKREQPIKLRVNQFKQVAIGEIPKLTLSTQAGSQIGGKNWSPLHNNIIGFDYEPGYIYDLLVNVTEIKNPPADGSSQAYLLKQVVSKTKVPTNTFFELNLKQNSTLFVIGDAINGYSVLDEIAIDCGNLMIEFDAAMHSNAKNITGKFILKDNGSIKLIALISD